MANSNEKLVIDIVTNLDEGSLKRTIKTLEKEIETETGNLGDLKLKHSAMNRRTTAAKKLLGEINEKAADIEAKKSTLSTYRNALSYKEQQKLEVRKGELSASKARVNLDRIAEVRKSEEARRRRLEYDRKIQAMAERKRAALAKNLSLKNLGLISRVARKFENVAIARLARGILNAVIYATRTGVQDLYKWSQNHNGMFAKAVDSIMEDFRYIADIIGSIVGPFIEQLAPIIRNIADAFAEAAERANQFFAALLGRNGYYRALRVARQYAGLQNQLLGFDELNVLKGENGAGGGNFEDVAYTGVETLSNIGKLITYAGYAQMGIGAILLFAGHPTVGAALIAAGFGTVLSTRPSDPNSKLQRFLKKASVIATGSMLALGAILLPANPVVGIGLLVAGVAGMVPSVALNWDAIVEMVRGPMGLVTALLGGFFLAIGAIMMIGGPGTIGLGIALMAAGALGLVGSVVINKDLIVDWVKNTLSKVLAIVGLLTVAVGALFMLCPATFSIGLGLLAAGLTSTVAGLAINPDAAVEGIRNMFTHIKQVATELWSEMIENLKAKWHNFWAPLREQFAKVEGWIAEVFGKHYKLDVEVPGYWTESYQNYHNQYSPDNFASGGTPRMGTLFWAGENGPEVVTSLNNQTTVYNEAQLTGSLAAANQGVVNAIYEMASAVVFAIDNKDISINDIRDAFGTQTFRYGL